MTFLELSDLHSPCRNTLLRAVHRTIFGCLLASLVASLPAQAASNEHLVQLKAPGAVPAEPNSTESEISAPLLGPVPSSDPASTYQSPLAQLLRSAARLIEIRQYDLAYQALVERADLYAGDVEFDYLLGVASIEYGRPDEAILALERVLINEPKHLQARAELARAYLLAKEQENAEREFKAVASQQIPDSAKRIINRYLDAISRVKNQPGPIINAQLRLLIGHDSNINVGSAQDSWLLADGTEVVPLPVSQPTSSAFLGIGAGVNIASPINGRLQWITGLSGLLQRYPSGHTLDQEQVDLSTGLAYRNDCHQFKMLGQLQTIRVDGDAFRDAVGAIGQWQCDLSANQQFGGFVQRFELSFPDDDARDASRRVVGFSFAQAIPSINNLIVLSTVQTGRESSKAGLENLSFDFKGIRMLLSAPFTSEWRGSLGINWEERRFKGAEPLFGVTRLDRQTEVRLGLESEIAENWTIQPQVVLTRNRSTLAPSDYRRTQAQLVAKYRLQ